MLYGQMNGARGIDYVADGLAVVELLRASAVTPSDKRAFGTRVGTLILSHGHFHCAGRNGEYFDD